MRALTSNPFEIRVSGDPYIATVDGGSASIEEFRNGSWRQALQLGDGVTSEPHFFQGGKIRVTGSGNFELRKVRF